MQLAVVAVLQKAPSGYLATLPLTAKARWLRRKLITGEEGVSDR